MSVPTADRTAAQQHSTATADRQKQNRFCGRMQRGKSAQIGSSTRWDDTGWDGMGGVQNSTEGSRVAGSWRWLLWPVRMGQPRRYKKVTRYRRWSVKNACLLVQKGSAKMRGRTCWGPSAAATAAGPGINRASRGKNRWVRRRRHERYRWKEGFDRGE